MTKKIIRKSSHGILSIILNTNFYPLFSSYEKLRERSDFHAINQHQKFNFITKLSKLFFMICP